jgi:hypothetical protein
MWVDRLGRAFARYLSQPRHDRVHVSTSRPELLPLTIQPGDVLLVEGSSRISVAIKYLTQSSWSHSAICIAAPVAHTNPDQESLILLEADVAEGVRLVPLSKYLPLHTRICRPVGLSAVEINGVIQHVMARVGHRYDMRHIWDLLRYLLPLPPVPVRWRRRLLALGSGDPTRAICSSLIAEAYHAAGYPILPRIGVLQAAAADAGPDTREVLHIRHYSLFTPRDFDVSPYFRIVKPTIEMGFDPHQVKLVG